MNTDLELINNSEESEMDNDEILSIVGQELSSAAGGNENDSLDADRQAAMAAYLGEKGETPEGKSSVVSTDVADSIEWIMPEMMKAFTQNNEIVTFDPSGEGDEKQAEMESKFVYDILMKDNDGFIIIHQLVKDALMQKNGFVKVFYSNVEKVTTNSYTELTEIEYNLVISNPKATVIEESNYLDEESGIPLFDIKVNIISKDKQLQVCSVAPEEFRVNRMHNSVSLADARFTAHVMYKTRSDLLEMGYDAEIIDDLPADPSSNDDRYYRFSMMGEVTEPEGGISNDRSQDILEIAECYMHIDLNQDGIAELVKITVAGWDSPTHVLDIEPIDEIPFISCTAILMSHKLFGLSIYDRIKEIQDQKTSLWRNILDNTYLQNNQRTIVVEGQVNLDDLMLSRPGGIIRASRPDAVIPYTTPPLGADSYKMMDYLDVVRSGRTGVSPEGAINQNAIGDKVGSEGVDRMMNQKEELVGLMIRVIAETGIKPICYMIRSLLIKHAAGNVDYKFRGNWITVDPTKWSSRSKTTVRVGTGSGNRMQQVGTLGSLLQVQQQMKATPGQVLVTPTHEFNLLDDIAKLGGFGGAAEYFVDPASPSGQQHIQQTTQQQQQEQQNQEQKDMSIIQAQLDLAKSEMRNAEIKVQLAAIKGESEETKNLLVDQKQKFELQIKTLEQQLHSAKLGLDSKEQEEDMTFKYWDREQYYNMEQYRIDQMAQAAKDNNKGSNNE